MGTRGKNKQSPILAFPKMGSPPVVVEPPTPKVEDAMLASQIGNHFPQGSGKKNNKCLQPPPKKRGRLEISLKIPSPFPGGN